MKQYCLRCSVRAVLLLLALGAPLAAQNTRVEVAKHTRAIPKSCESITPANIEGTVDVQALVKEAICKGAGDMLTEYTYTVNSVKREKDKKGNLKKEETFIYEVFIPTLKSGTRTRGVLVVTSHNGVAVPAAELEKARLEAAEKIEKEEERIARSQPTTTVPEPDKPGLTPAGMYTRTGVTRSAFGMKSGALTFAIADFLRASDLTLARRENIDGRDTLVFNFTPRPGTNFIDSEKYMTQIRGEIRIDAADRIVTRLIGWPIAPNRMAQVSKPGDPVTGEAPRRTYEEAMRLPTPAVYQEMTRLPKGIWLPRVIRLNGADYQTLFDGITTDTTSTYSNYIRFSTEIKDVEVAPPTNP
jgi:hypothetical protein